MGGPVGRITAEVVVRTIAADDVEPAVAVKPRRGAKPDPTRPTADMWPWWVSTPPRLEGNPRPSWESHFGGDYFHGDRLGRFAHKCERPLFGWQWECERKILATRPDGLWAHSDVCLVIPRQNGKTQIVIWRILYGLFYLGEKIVYTAQKWLTVEDVYDRIVDIIKSRPSLKRRLLPFESAPEGYTKSGNHGAIKTRNGGELEMGPRTKAVGRGMTRVDLAIFDEAYDLKDVHRQDTAGARLASDNPQIILISTAAVASLHPNCHVLSGTRWNGIRHAPDLYAAEWRAPDGHKRDDPEAWRLGMPSFGVTVRAREIASDFRAAKTSAARALVEADYLGWGEWPPDADDVEPKIDLEVWDRLVKSADTILVGDVVLAVERTLDRKIWVIAAGRRTHDGRVHLEVGYYRAAHIGIVCSYLLQLIELWDPAAIIVDDRSMAKPIVAAMLKLGWELEVTNTPQLAAATGGIVDAIEAEDICHMGQAILRDAVDGAMTRVLPKGDFVWDDTDGSLAPLKAITLAHDGVLRFAEESRPAARPSTGEGIVDLDAERDDIGADDVMGAAF